MHNHMTMIGITLQKSTSDPKKVFSLLLFQRNTGGNSCMNEQIGLDNSIQRKRMKPRYAFFAKSFAQCRRIVTSKSQRNSKTCQSFVAAI